MTTTKKIGIRTVYTSRQMWKIKNFKHVRIVSFMYLKCVCVCVVILRLLHSNPFITVDQARDECKQI